VAIYLGSAVFSDDLLELGTSAITAHEIPDLTDDKFLELAVNGHAD
jgi:hypothetical protein